MDEYEVEELVQEGSTPSGSPSHDQNKRKRDDEGPGSDELSYESEDSIPPDLQPQKRMKSTHPLPDPIQPTAFCPPETSKRRHEDTSFGSENVSKHYRTGSERTTEQPDSISAWRATSMGQPLAATRPVGQAMQPPGRRTTFMGPPSVPSRRTLGVQQGLVVPTSKSVEPREPRNEPIALIVAASQVQRPDRSPTPPASIESSLHPAPKATVPIQPVSQEQSRLSEIGEEEQRLSEHDLSEEPSVAEDSSLAWTSTAHVTGQPASFNAELTNDNDKSGASTSTVVHHPSRRFSGQFPWELFAEEQEPSEPLPRKRKQSMRKFISDARQNQDVYRRKLRSAAGIRTGALLALDSKNQPKQQSARGFVW